MLDYQLGCLVLGSLTFQLLALILGQITSYLGKSFPAPAPCRLLHMFASIRFCISGFKLKSLIYLELIFVQCERYGSSFTLLQVGIIFPVSFVEGAVFTHVCFWHLCQISDNCSCVCLCLDFCISLVYMPVFASVPCCFTTVDL